MLGGGTEVEYPALSLRSDLLDILRMLKRAIAREMFRLLTHQIPVADYSELRPTRQAKNISLTAAGEIFDVWPNIISRLERRFYRNDTMADQYREWLTAA
jgi:transposase